MWADLLSDAVLEDLVSVPFVFTRPVFEVRQAKQDGGDSIYIGFQYSQTLQQFSYQILLHFVSSSHLHRTCSGSLWRCSGGILFAIGWDWEGVWRCLETNISLKINLNNLLLTWEKFKINSSEKKYYCKDAVRKKRPQLIANKLRMCFGFWYERGIQCHHKAFSPDRWGEGMMPEE